MSWIDFSNYNSDNVVRTIENNETIAYIGEGTTMEKKINKALGIYVDIDGTRKMDHKFEKLLTNRWFDWKTHISYTQEAFINILSSLTEGIGYKIINE